MTDDLWVDVSDALMGWTGIFISHTYSGGAYLLVTVEDRNVNSVLRDLERNGFTHDLTRVGPGHTSIKVTR